MSKTWVHHLSSPLGGITMASDGQAIIGLWFDGQKYFGTTLHENSMDRPLPVFAEADRWLTLYFRGEVPDFMPPIALPPEATPFRRSVWALLSEIPYGETTTYGELARILTARRGGAPTSARAIGNAVAHNPISLLLPCHRVLGAAGSLTGYAGGLERKQWLLRLERGSLTGALTGDGSVCGQPLTGDGPLCEQKGS